MTYYARPRSRFALWVRARSHRRFPVVVYVAAVATVTILVQLLVAR